MNEQQMAQDLINKALIEIEERIYPLFNPAISELEDKFVQHLADNGLLGYYHQADSKMLACSRQIAYEAFLAGYALANAYSSGEGE